MKQLLPFFLALALITGCLSKQSAVKLGDPITYSEDDTKRSGTTLDTLKKPVLSSVMAEGGSFKLVWSQPGPSTHHRYDIVVDGVDTNRTHRTQGLETVIEGLARGEHCFKVQARFLNEGPSVFRRSNELCADSTSSSDIEAPVLEKVLLEEGSFQLFWSQPGPSTNNRYDIMIDGVDTNRADRVAGYETTVTNLDSGMHCFRVQARFLDEDPSVFRRSNEVCANSNTGIVMESACGTSTPDCSSRFNMSGKHLNYYRNYSIDEGLSQIRHLVIVIHGASRTAGSYFRSVVRSARRAGKLSSSLIIAPHYKIDEDPREPGEFEWYQYGGRTSWKRGGGCRKHYR